MIVRLLRLAALCLALPALGLASSAALAQAAPAPAAQARTGPVQTGHVELELISGSTAAVPGATVQVALRQKIAPGWHTYWRQSGDAGQPTEVAWTLTPGVTAAAPVWPTPHRMREADLMTFGYTGEVIAPIAVTLAKSVGGVGVHLTARVDLLVCKDICVPEGADLALDLPLAPNAAPSPQWSAVIEAALAAAPKPAPFAATARLAAGKLDLAFAGPALKDVDPRGAYFFPYDAKPILLHARQGVERGPDGLTLHLTASPEAGAKLTAPLTGVLVIGDRAWEVTAKPGPALTGAGGGGEAPAADEAAAPSKPDATGAAGFFLALGAGLLGGLILNLMPCVFPVLAIKAAALARHAHSPAEARLHGVIFLVGVVTTFLILAGALLFARAAGESVGWGFQLQSPAVTAALALLVFAVGLNLSGLFEAGLSVQRVGGAAPTGDGLVGAFLTGALAVLVAAPCTAPFMVLATGYALTASTPLALCVFAALGVGLALPFTLLCFSPRLLARLPRPGAWMEQLRHLLAFPMYAAAAWLAGVFLGVTNADSMGLLLDAAIVLALALFLFGAAQQRQAEGAPTLVRLLGAGASVTAALFLTAMAVNPTPPALSPEPFSPARVAELRAQGRPVFVNLTAAWCITCKFNDEATLSQPQVGQAFARTHTAYLVGDWTKRDAVIARTLAEHGHAGVPLYLLYKPGVAEPLVLPQILTPDLVVKAVEGK